MTLGKFLESFTEYKSLTGESYLRRNLTDNVSVKHYPSSGVFLFEYFRDPSSWTSSEIDYEVELDEEEDFETWFTHHLHKFLEEMIYEYKKIRKTVDEVDSLELF